jgi:hypothetical protein
MQIMPDSWAELRVRYALGSDPFDPQDKILAGTAYLREMLDRFGSEGFLAAYNAGLQRYEEHLGTGRPLPGETQIYVARIAALTQIARGEAPVFVAGSGSKSDVDERMVTAGMMLPAGQLSVGYSFAQAPRTTGLFVRQSSEVQSR